MSSAVDPTTSPYRWVVLSVVALANGTVAAVSMGMPVLAPALRDALSLSLTELGMVLAALEGGIGLTPLIWGRLADRCGERPVVAGGLLCGAVALGAAASVATFAGLLVSLVLCGMLIGGASTASGSAILGWFGGHQRGLALGIRQMFVPIGGAAAAVGLPLLIAGGGVRSALWVLAGLAAVVAVIGVACIREAPAPPIGSGPPAAAPKPPLLDARVWRASLGGGIVVCAQAALIGFVVVFLHEHHGMSVAGAAGVLAVTQACSAVARLATGRCSDITGRRVPPQRKLSLAAAIGFTLSAVLAEAPLELLVPVLVVTGALVMSGGGLAIAATAEFAGRENAGTAIGLFQTFARLLSALAGVGFGTIVASTSWPAGFVVLAGLCLVGWWILRTSEDDEEERISGRRSARSAPAAPAWAPSRSPPPGRSAGSRTSRRSRTTGSARSPGPGSPRRPARRSR